MKKIIFAAFITLTLSGCTKFPQEEALAKIEIKTLIPTCAELYWNTDPMNDAEEPNLNEPIEMINKCVHMNAELEKTKQLIEDSEWSYWPNQVLTADDAEDLSKWDFMKPDYPSI